MAVTNLPVSTDLPVLDILHKWDQTAWSFVTELHHFYASKQADGMFSLQ